MFHFLVALGAELDPSRDPAKMRDRPKARPFAKDPLVFSEKITFTFVFTCAFAFTCMFTFTFTFVFPFPFAFTFTFWV